jgi:hypothetical protein
MVGLEVLADGPGDGVQVAGIAGDDQVMAARCALHDARIDNVDDPGPPRDRSRRLRPHVVQGFNVASDDQAGKLSLPGSTPPSLSQHRSRHRRNLAAQQQRPMTHPHPPLAPFGGKTYANRLRTMHEQIEETGPFVATSVRFLIEARKPI